MSLCLLGVVGILGGCTRLDSGADTVDLTKAVVREMGTAPGERDSVEPMAVAISKAEEQGIDTSRYTLFLDDSFPDDDWQWLVCFVQREADGWAAGFPVHFVVCADHAGRVRLLKGMGERAAVQTAKKRLTEDGIDLRCYTLSSTEFDGVNWRVEFTETGPPASGTPSRHVFSTVVRPDASTFVHRAR